MHLLFAAAAAAAFLNCTSIKNNESANDSEKLRPFIVPLSNRCFIKFIVCKKGNMPAGVG